jgi:hypothetical protein
MNFPAHPQGSTFVRVAETQIHSNEISLITYMITSTRETFFIIEMCSALESYIVADTKPIHSPLLKPFKLL